MKKNDIVTPKEGKYCGKNGVIRNTVKMYIATSFEHCEKYDVKFENGEVIFFSENELTLVKEGKFDAIQVKVINKSRHNLPEYATDYSAGMDIRADIDESVVIKPLERAFFPTGLYIALPVGYEAQLRPRSGLACKHGITLANSPSTIDADYRGEIKVCLINLSNEPFIVEPGERICQMVVAKHEVVEWNLVEELDKTVRGDGGFGSTGKN